MPYRKEKFATGEIYHIVSRGIDDNLLFKSIDDNYRGIFSIYEFNDSRGVEIRDRRRARIKFKEATNSATKACGERVSASSTDYRDKLVEVIAFCLMPNHIHLLARQIKDGSLVKFMRKFGAGYGGYFNKKYNRRGHIFQNNFKAVHIKTDNQLMAVWAYIHANPASLIEPKWKERGIHNFKKTIKFLENYKWSSCSDYLGIANFPSVTERDFILEMIGGQKKCEDFLNDYLKYRGRVKEPPELTLE